MTCFDATFQSAALTSARTRIGADGGMSISVPAGQSRLALNLPELRALDLHDSPDLVELDISTAAAAFHLTVIGCPKLDRVKFPPAGAALVHLDSGPHVPELVLEGGVELVDACWAGGQFLLRAEDGTTWDGVHIGRLDPSADRVELTGRGLNVRVGTDRAAESLVVVSLSVKALALVGLGRTRRLRWADVEGKPCHSRALYVLDAPALETIEVQRQFDHLVVEACPEVTRIARVPSATPTSESGSAAAAIVTADERRPATRQVQIRRGSGAQRGLTIDWPCDELNIVDSRIEQLVVVQPCALVLQRNWKLDQVSLHDGCRIICEGLVPPALVGIARVHVDRGLLWALVERYRGGEAGVWPKLESTLVAASSRK